jgi:hypothetical protein
VTTIWNAVPAAFEDNVYVYVRHVSNFLLLQPFKKQPDDPPTDQVSYDVYVPVVADPSTTAGAVHDCARDARGPCSSSNTAT